jgi:SAM-dependent methyltransferase
MNPIQSDSASAYETHAQAFLHRRDDSPIGAAAVAQWARTLSAGAEVIELACGGGYPITRVLHAAGLKLWAIDSSATLLAAFSRRFPAVPARCESVQTSDFFGRSYDAAIAVGLLFLLSEHDQQTLIERVARIIVPGGRFLFSAPIETGSWNDRTTGIVCRSLGRVGYEACLNAAGFRVVATFTDTGQNNYYDAQRIHT